MVERIGEYIEGEVCWEEVGVNGEIGWCERLAGKMEVEVSGS